MFSQNYLYFPLGLRCFSAQMFNRIPGVYTDSIKENIHRILYPKTLILRERAERAKGMRFIWLKTPFFCLGSP